MFGIFHRFFPFSQSTFQRGFCGELPTVPADLLIVLNLCLHLESRIGPDSAFSAAVPDTEAVFTPDHRRKTKIWPPQRETTTERERTEARNHEGVRQRSAEIFRRKPIGLFSQWPSSTCLFPDHVALV